MYSLFVTQEAQLGELNLMLYFKNKNKKPTTLTNVNNLQRPTQQDCDLKMGSAMWKMILTSDD